jgi:O-acetyl-ADP-ribose deacetylase (regulator of RNase III)
LFVFELAASGRPCWIVNFPTKRHWRQKSRIEEIGSGLIDLVRVIQETGAQSMALPPLGCGFGGLDWDFVRPLIPGALAEVPLVDAVIFEPGATPPAATA